jgi:hypothetical protein
VYPEVTDSEGESGYRQRKVVHRNSGNGKFAEVSGELGPGIAERVAGRGMAVGDFDNDGDLDLLVNCVNSAPQLLRCDAPGGQAWVKVKCIGTKSNRTAIGARVTCTAGGKAYVDEVRSGGSYLSQNDLRVHFGLGTATSAVIEVRWPAGGADRVELESLNRVVTVVEGKGLSAWPANP